MQWEKYDPILTLILNLHLVQLSVVSAEEDEMIKASTHGYTFKLREARILCFI